MLYILTIRKSRVKEYVSKTQLDLILNTMVHTGLRVLHKGYHLHGKYRQLHLHAIVFHYKPITTWTNGFRIYWTKLKPTLPDRERALNYLHSEDYNNPIKLQHILIENDANHHYLFV